ncbi:sulfotransferase [Emcibacter sp. SYSU 3D8]|uniref:sulfotransferase n=1 Tax=Emcibacter sp. SYSU 3D8 TaxID=3133969 RepID=UPI0031FEDAB6
MSAASFLFQRRLSQLVKSERLRTLYILLVVYPAAWIDYFAHRRLFENIRAYVTFIGYPRSGHSLVGALLNAHPQALIAHELFATRYFRLGFRRQQVLALLLRRDVDFTERGRVNAGYSYDVPGGFQGVHDCLLVVGDKKAGGTIWSLRERPGLLGVMRRRMAMPMRFVHSVRNPYDNIATMSRREQRSVAYTINRYRKLAVTCQQVMERLEPEELLQQWHEDFVEDVEGHMSQLCAFVGLEADPAFLAACDAVVFESPKLSRDSVIWTAEDVEQVEALCRELPFLARYAGSPVTIGRQAAA